MTVKHPAQINTCKTHPHAPLLRAENKCFACWSVTKADTKKSLQTTQARSSYFAPLQLRTAAQRMFQRGAPKPSPDDEFAADLRLLRD